MLNLLKSSIHALLHDPLTNASNKDTFTFILVILKRISLTTHAYIIISLTYDSICKLNNIVLFTDT